MSSTEFNKGNSKYLLLCANACYSIYMRPVFGSDKSSYKLVENTTKKTIKESEKLSELKKRGGF